MYQTGFLQILRDRVHR